MASGPITSWQIDGETMGTVTDFIFLGSKITADGDCSHETRRRLLLGRKAMTNLDSTFKSRDITLLTKVHPVKAMVFPVVMYGCESRKQLDMTERLNWTDTLSHFLTSNVARNMTDNKNRMESGNLFNMQFAKSWTWLSNWSELNWHNSIKYFHTYSYGEWWSGNIKFRYFV